MGLNTQPVRLLLRCPARYGFTPYPSGALSLFAPQHLAAANLADVYGKGSSTRRQALGAAQLAAGAAAPAVSAEDVEAATAAGPLTYQRLVEAPAFATAVNVVTQASDDGIGSTCRPSCAALPHSSPA
jgi:hypothetical protein